MTFSRPAPKIAHIGFSSHSLDFAIKLIEEPIFETIKRSLESARKFIEDRGQGATGPL